MRRWTCCALLAVLAACGGSATAPEPDAPAKILQDEAGSGGTLEQLAQIQAQCLQEALPWQRVSIDRFVMEWNLCVMRRWAALGGGA